VKKIETPSKPQAGKTLELMWKARTMRIESPRKP
jgi:hypothetical protein